MLGECKGSPKMNARAARSLQFSGPPVPKFLQSLHSQVHGSQGSGSKASRGGDELDELLSLDPDRPMIPVRPGGPENDQGEISGDEWDGAQIVVLKDGRHLTADEVKQAAKDCHPPSMGSNVSNSSVAVGAKISQPGSGITGSKRRAPVDDSTAISHTSASSETQAQTGISSAKMHVANYQNGMGEAKDLIFAKKRQREDEQISEKEKKRKAKEDERQRKNRAAKNEKKKSGKGLSFDLEG
ncbi:hypothetical protein K437DRAFT_295473 [Tilletiaria anomala UBC 951]|uniref:DUF4604 domain-containing protein n=1 Tax=Tilletiaria anomala (strain ATCC 24038 / CBS 436.72 / UBC 951) TaxID=1037660 RepID=A0A066VNW1_TILAU|nr:uncharacterized protein K437DRAFT_295473 [Tilletiaria anomala UBC 951]KDN41983.1 hypothetical protein K437DRAFT_295473 [Tilletiaria anomala UBC 951]